MGKSLINKHIDNASGLTRELFNDELRKAKGEIIINNDPDNPSIFIVNNNDQVVKISGSSSGGEGGGSYDDTELRVLINTNTENINKINKELENWKEGSYDDTELRNLITENTERIDAIEENGVSTVLQEPITVAGLTGVLGAGNYNNNDVISAGTSIIEIIQNILCKELFPTNVKTRTASVTVSLKDLSLELSVDNINDIIEVGTLIKLIKGETNGVTLTINDSRIYNMDNGYSFEDDNERDSKKTYISSSIETGISDNTFIISSVISKGFDADENKKNTPTQQENTGNVSLLETEIGCINEGDNTIAIYATGATYSYSAESVNGVYYCSNLGKTNTNHYISGISAVQTTLTNTPTKSKSITVKGAYKYFLGYSPYTNIEDFESKYVLVEPEDVNENNTLEWTEINLPITQYPDENIKYLLFNDNYYFWKDNSDIIRNLNIRTDWAIKNQNDEIVIVDDTSIKSNGESIIIACHQNYTLKSIKTGIGSDMLESFISGNVLLRTGSIYSNYKLYILPIKNNSIVEFKNVILG